MTLNEIVLCAKLSAEERAVIAEIEATTCILKLVARLTQMRFAGIAKFTETEWIVSAAYDPNQLGISPGDVWELEATLCSELRRNPRALFVPQISQDVRYSARAVVKKYAIESYAGVAIFLPDGRLYGALCALDSRPMLFDEPGLEETLTLFAWLIGCIFSTHLSPDGN
ncbi:GAF domain-containing protein [Pseudomonas sp. TNT11]|uniref:GAF domain-containing protein n=1 Tax=Pseudomonas emilianonis TaxID=2915812 RepID=A0ABT0EH59_9PSED|nr:GAF domain-containing protein [Pseudomonas emilianonis]MCK1785057.1 GAF domain-containing protein [Pseudomonas emilianonis]